MMRPALLCLLLTACGCSQAVSLSKPFEPVLLKQHTMPAAYAVTTCSLNNLPVILVDSASWDSPDLEIFIKHEEVHAQRAYAYRGGCWPYMYRIAADTAFRAREQYLAFCAAGQFAMRRNRNPMTVWDYIVRVMRPDSALKPTDNCLYEPWEKQQ